MLTRLRRASLGLVIALLVGASPTAHAEPLTAAQRTERCEGIRDVAADNGISAGYLFAGIASAETNLSHCHTELSWACEGPTSPDCADAPVVAGAGDGPCSLMEGGLGMFQFDGGTFAETIERDGDGVLLLSGNTTRAIDFVVNMMINSQYFDVTTPEEAKAVMNQVTVDGPLFEDWITTVTHYYNGCVPGSCSVFDQRYQHYADNLRDVFEEQGAPFWVVELPPCANIPSEGRTLEETDTCFTKGGPLPFWRVGMGGESNLHVWTGTTTLADAVNFAEWRLSFDEPGEYLVEASVTTGTAALATYIVEHAGTSESVVIDQSMAEGFVELGTFTFDASDEGGGAEQRVFLGDNTGEDDEKLVVDALRLTRVGAPVNGSGAGGSGSGTGSGAGGSTSNGGAGGDGGGGEFTSGRSTGCDCSTSSDRSSTSTFAIGLLLAVVGLGRRSSRLVKMFQ